MRLLHDKIKQRLHQQINKIAQSNFTKPLIIKLQKMENKIKQYQQKVSTNFQLKIEQTQTQREIPTIEIPLQIKQSLTLLQLQVVQNHIQRYVNASLKLQNNCRKIGKQIHQLSMSSQNNVDLYTLDNIKHQEQFNKKIEAERFNEDDINFNEFDIQMEMESNQNTDANYLSNQYNSDISNNSTVIQINQQKNSDKTEQKDAFDHRKHYVSALAEYFGKKKKAALSTIQIQSLQQDLTKSNMSKQYIQRKYNISQSTLYRYTLKFKQFEQDYIKNIHKQPLQILNKSSYTNQAQNLKDSNHKSYRKSLPRIKKLSRVKMIEQNVIQIYKKHPNIYLRQAAQILTKQFQLPISLHIVCRCLKNIQQRKKLMQNQFSSIFKQFDLQKIAKYATLQQNSQKNIEFRFRFSKQLLAINEDHIIFIDQKIFRNNPIISSECNINKINFVLAVMSSGKIVHWKIKNQSFKPEEIAKFLQELAIKFNGFTIVLDSARIHKDQKIKNTILNKSIKVLFQPPYSQHVNPVESIFNLFADIFQKKIGPQLNLQETLRLAHSTILQLKDTIFSKQIQRVKLFIKLAYQKLPFPIDKSSQMPDI